MEIPSDGITTKKSSHNILHATFSCQSDVLPNLSQSIKLFTFDLFPFIMKGVPDI